VGLLEDGVEGLKVSKNCFNCSEMPQGKVYTSTGRSTRLKSAKGASVNWPMMLAQCREKGGSARGVRCAALQSICDRGEDKYEGFVGIAKEQLRKS